MFWPHTAARVRIGETLFADFSSRSPNQSMRVNLAGDGFTYADQFSPRCFRRGATQELLNAGPSTGSIKSAGFWRAMGFRAYIDTQMTDALKIDRFVTSAVNSDIEDDTDAPVNVAFGLTTKKRPNVSRTGEMAGR